MDDLFEAYVAAAAKRASRGQQWTVHAQGGGLFCLREEGDGGRQRFQTKPELLINQGYGTKLVIDTKWSVLNNPLSQCWRGFQGNFGGQDLQELR